MNNLETLSIPVEVLNLSDIKRLRRAPREAFWDFPVHQNALGCTTSVYDPRPSPSDRQRCASQSSQMTGRCFVMPYRALAASAGSSARSGYRPLFPCMLLKAILNHKKLLL